MINQVSEAYLVNFALWASDLYLETLTFISVEVLSVSEFYLAYFDVSINIIF